MYGGEGPVEPPAAECNEHTFDMGDLARSRRRTPWFACLSAITTPVPLNRWGQDRQNFLSLYHDRAGLVIGGGDTKLQPLWSSFTVGDPELLGHTPGDEDPDFTPREGLLHVPDSARLEPEGARLKYGALECCLHLRFDDDATARIELSAVGGRGTVQAHLTLLPRPGQPLRHSSGQEALVGDDALDWSIEDEGSWVEHAGWRLSLPPHSRCRWPVLPHNPYRKDGAAETHEGRIVVSLPLTDGQPVELTLRIL